MSEKKTFDVIWALVGIALFYVVSSLFIQTISKFDETFSTKKQALVLAYQLWQTQIEVNKKNSNSNFNTPVSKGDSRSLASNESNKDMYWTSIAFKKEGILGLDRWSRPFNYEFYQNNHEAKIVVWSSGANQINDSASTIPNIKNDDIGEVLDITEM